MLLFLTALEQILQLSGNISVKFTAPGSQILWKNLCGIGLLRDTKAQHRQLKEPIYSGL